ncbi:uncharacterized protein V6R79_005787 [Siganus canaliculatus]
MPRKTRKTDKAPLLFLERSLCGARLQNVPEVRAAVNPKEFFPERQEQNSTTLTSWVSPQFDSSGALPARRGRRKCLSATSILDSCSQLSRRSSVCKFPPLSFQTRSEDQSHQPRSTRSKKATEPNVVPETGNRPQGSCRIRSTVSSAHYSDTPKRQTTSVRKRNVQRHSGGAASSSKCPEQPASLSFQVTDRSGKPAVGSSTPTSSDFITTEDNSVGPPPDVDTPKVIQEQSNDPAANALHLLFPQSCTPPCNEPADILVADTPERDYGLKVTWRRRRGLMLLLKERGHASDSDVFILS